MVLRWARVAGARCLCSLGDWDEAELEIEAVKDDLPTFQLSMASAPLAAIALGRGQADRLASIVADYDRRCSEAGASMYEPDFRVMRALALAVLAADEEWIARLIPESESGDYAEWTGWLSATVDQLVGDGTDEALAAALETLRQDGRMKRVPQVQAQSERLQAHLLLRGSDLAGALAAFDRARGLAGGCGLRFEAAVIAFERAQARGAGVGDPSLGEAVAVFQRLRAKPWLLRSSEFAARASA
jgi:hypothetical protein